MFKEWQNQTDKQFSKRVSKWFGIISKHLRKVIEPFKKIPDLTYYMARHAFINRINGLDIPHSTIRKLIGHAEGSLKEYIAPPTDWEIADITAQIFNQGATVRELLENRIINENITEDGNIR